MKRSKNCIVIGGEYRKFKNSFKNVKNSKCHRFFKNWRWKIENEDEKFFKEEESIEI